MSPYRTPAKPPGPQDSRWRRVAFALMYGMLFGSFLALFYVLGESAVSACGWALVAVLVARHRRP